MEKQNQPKNGGDRVSLRDRHSHKIMLAKHLWWSTLPAVVALVVIAVWAVGNSYFAKYKINNQLVSVRASDIQLKNDVSSVLAAYRLKIVYPDGSVKTFSIGDIGIRANVNATISSLHKQQDNLAARLKWWQPISVHIITTTDPHTLNSFVAKNVSIVKAPAQNASLTIKNGSVVLASAVTGKEYSLPNATTTIANQVRQLQTKPIKLQLVSVKPSLTAAELASSESKLKQAIDQKITFDINGQIIAPTPTTIASWISLTPDTAAKTVNVGVDSSAITSYLNRLAGNYTRVPKDQVNITNADGSTSVLVAGSSGQIVGNIQATAAALGQSLLSGNGSTYTLPVTATAYGTITAGNWPKWIEVNLTTKRMYAYEYGSLVNSFLISAGKPSTPTPTGEFHIWEKLTSQTMTGPGYVQPNVPWVNYFDHSGDAIHGNYWRAASVFGSVNTSHGCVGIQVAPSKWVYGWAPIGTPIVIHK